MIARIGNRYGRFMPLRPRVAHGYRPCNPGIVRTENGYLVICRTVKFDRPRRPRDDAHHTIQTRNILMRLAPDLEVIGECSIELDETPLRPSAVRGLEDCRPFEIDRSISALCATGDRHPSGFIHQSVCRISADGRVLAHRPLVGEMDDRHQKNWLPFVDGYGTVRAIYGYKPFIVLRLDIEAGRYVVETQVAEPRGSADWRGSAGPIAVPDSDRLLMLVHEVRTTYVPAGCERRVYLHRFIECDEHFSLTHVSRPFVFAHHGIEFACSMALAHDNRTLLIGLGLEDVRAYLYELPLSRVDLLLQSIS